jgi:hypothetical protein
MRILNFELSRKNINYSVLALLTTAFLFACKKDNDVKQKPAISYKQKTVSLAEDMPMTPLKPDSTGGAITEYSVAPSLPKGIMINKLNGEISGTPSDTLLPAKFVVKATGPGGFATDTLTISVGTVAFNYGDNATFTFEKGATDISTTPLSPVILAGTFTQFFVSPSPDSLTIKTGLKFNSSTGQISGTPTVLTSTTEVPKPVTFTITGISTANKATSTSISFIINDKKPAFYYANTNTFTVGTSVANTLSITKLGTSGNIIKYRLAPTSPALPAGLTLDSLTGKISGIPTAAANTTIIIRGLNTGGFQDVNLPLVVDATAVAPQAYYLMSFISGNITDTVAPRFQSGNTIYVTKNDGVGQLNVYLTPVITAGQVASFAAGAPGVPFASGLANENISLTTSTGVVSGTPGQFTTISAYNHTLALNNAATAGPAGTFNMNIVANSPFFTYNTNGKGGALPNIFAFMKDQKLDVANGSYPGFTSTETSPVNGAGVVSYSIYSLTAASPALSTIGLNFNTTTGAISGTPTVSTFNFGIYSYYDYVVVGKKADGSFTVYKIRVKIYGSTTDYGT